MKTISIVVPCYNEEENVGPLADALREMFRKDLPDYRYEILFIDNDSRDKTRDLIRGLCAGDQGIKGIFNAKNFGQFNSPYYGMLQTTGDCTILMAADFQDPVEMIPKYVKEWENGYKIVIGIKKSSQENPVMYWLRGCYYKLIKKLSDVEQIEQFTGFGLYDKRFIEVLRNLDDPTPFLRGIVAELGFRRKEIPYEQPLRRAGKTSNNFYRLYDAALLSITSYTKAGLRHDRGDCLSGTETDILGPLCSRHGAIAYRHVLFRLCPDLFYRSGGRIYPDHQCQGHETASGGGRRTD